MRNDTAKSLRTGVQFSSEVLFPGGSNLVKGDLKQGGIHAVLGVAARMAFGFPGLLLVSANSLSKAVTGRHLYESVASLDGSPGTPTPVPDRETPAALSAPTRSRAPYSASESTDTPVVSSSTDESQPSEKKKRTPPKPAGRRDASGKLKT